MFDRTPQTGRPYTQALLGFLLAIVASLLCLFISVFLGSTLGPRHSHIYPVFTGIGLAFLGVFALRSARRSGFAFGAVIALALALLLDGAYMVVTFR